MKKNQARKESVFEKQLLDAAALLFVNMATTKAEYARIKKRVRVLAAKMERSNHD